MLGLTTVHAAVKFPDTLPDTPVLLARVGPTPLKSQR